MLRSEDFRFRAGDRVVVNGYGLGEVHHGGYAERARVPSDWLIKLPETISTSHAMAIGTAGYTAMLCVLAGVRPDRSCGLAQGSDLPATVLPFILRNVTLAGVNSVWTSREKREEAWRRLASDLDLAKLNRMTSRARLDEVPALAVEILEGKTRGRVVIDL